MKQIFQIIFLGSVLIAIILVSQNIFAQTSAFAQTKIALNTVSKGTNINSAANQILSDTTPCKTYISFTNNYNETLKIELWTNKKITDRWGNKIDEKIVFNLSSGKTKKVKVESAGTYKYETCEGIPQCTSNHSQGIVETEECKTVSEEID